MHIEIINEMGPTLVNLDDVERVALEGDHILVVHRRTGSGKQWTDTYPFVSVEAAGVEFANLKEQMNDLQQLSPVRPHRLRPAAPVMTPSLKMGAPVHVMDQDQEWTEAAVDKVRPRTTTAVETTAEPGADRE